jgi:hypothetical protein
VVDAQAQAAVGFLGKNNVGAVWRGGVLDESFVK